MEKVFTRFFREIKNKTYKRKVKNMYNKNNKNKRDRIFLAKLKNGLKIVLLLVVLILGLRLVDDRPPVRTLEDYIEKNNERMRQQENQKKLEDYKSLTIQEKLEYEQKINK